MGVSVVEEARHQTRGRRASYLVSGVVSAILGLGLVVLGASNGSTTYLLGNATYSPLAFLSGVIGGLLLGSGVVLLSVGIYMGKYVFVIR